MISKIKPGLLVALACTWPLILSASHLTYFGTIDAINFDFGPGGGSYEGNLAGTDDDDWLTFEAAAGEVVNLTYASVGAQFIDVVIFRDENDNGQIEVGDVADVLDFNSDQSGNGTDIVVQHGGFADSSCAAPGSDFYCVGLTPIPHAFTAPVSGQYVIGISSANEGQATGYSVQIDRGPVSRGPSVPIPVNASWALVLLVLMLAAMGVWTMRRGDYRN